MFVVNAPSGRALIQQALRVFYRNPSIGSILNPGNFLPESGKPAILVTCNLLPDGDLQVQLAPIE